MNNIYLSETIILSENTCLPILVNNVMKMPSLIFHFLSERNIGRSDPLKEKFHYQQKYNKQPCVPIIMNEVSFIDLAMVIGKYLKFMSYVLFLKTLWLLHCIITITDVFHS